MRKDLQKRLLSVRITEKALVEGTSAFSVILTLGHRSWTPKLVEKMSKRSNEIGFRIIYVACSILRCNLRPV